MEMPAPHEIFEIPADVYVTYRALYDRFGEDYGLTRRVSEFIAPLALGNVTPDDIAISRTDRDDVIDAWEARRREQTDTWDRAHIMYRLGGGSVKQAISELEHPPLPDIRIITSSEIEAGASLEEFIRS